MSLNKDEKDNLSKLLSFIKLSEITNFPISNILTIPLDYMQYDIVLQGDKKVYGFSIFEAIQKCNFSETVITLDKNGMNFFYTQSIEKQMLWMPDIRDTIKDVKGTVLVVQEFPQDGKCISKFIKAEDVKDEAIKPFLNENLVIFQDANFYIRRENLEVLADTCNRLWQEDRLKPANKLTTLHNTTAY